MKLKNNSFEKLNNKVWKRITITGVCAIAILLVGMLATSKSKYRVTDSIKIGEGVVNYKLPDFKVMAMYQQNSSGTYDEVTTMPTSGYTINEEKTYCTTDNVNQVKGKVKTINGEITLKNITKSDKCYLYFDRVKNILNIIASNKINIGSPDFSKVATTDEGMYATNDNVYGGQSYYWRGATTTNYVRFANFCWRIVRINGDGTMRLIYDGTTCHANGTNTAESIAKTNQVYNSSCDRSEYVGYTYLIGSQRTTSGTASNLKTQIESWYNSNLASYATKIADGKYCNDRNTAVGYSWSSQPSSMLFYAAGGRLENTKTPSLSCNSGDVYTLKAGAITVDEVSFAGGVYNAINSSYYLYNGQNYWTMSPYYWFYIDTSTRWACVFRVNSSGYITFDFVNNNTFGVRPVINLRSDITFSGGTGVQSDPFVVAN